MKLKLLSLCKLFYILCFIFWFISNKLCLLKVHLIIVIFLYVSEARHISDDPSIIKKEELADMIDIIEEANKEKNEKRHKFPMRSIPYEKLYDMNDVINFANKSFI